MKQNKKLASGFSYHRATAGCVDEAPASGREAGAEAAVVLLAVCLGGQRSHGEERIQLSKSSTESDLSLNDCDEISFTMARWFAVALARVAFEN